MPPGFEPTTLKSLLKSTCAGRGHFELLLSLRGEISSSIVILGLWVRIQAGNFPKIAFQSRISNYVYIQPLHSELLARTMHSLGNLAILISIGPEVNFYAL